MSARWPLSGKADIGADMAVGPLLTQFGHWLGGYRPGTGSTFPPIGSTLPLDKTPSQGAGPAIQLASGADRREARDDEY
jgi:hypothetical protein